MAISSAPIQAWAYSDTNGNGIPEAGEPPLSGVAIELSGSSVPGTWLSLKTDSQGRAWFGPGWLVDAATKLTVVPPSGLGNSKPFHRAYYLDGSGVPPYQGLGTVGPNSITFVNANYRNTYIMQGTNGDYDFAGWSEAFYFGFPAGTDLAVTSLQDDPGGVVFTYSLTGKPLSQDTTAVLYWATGPNKSDILLPATTPVTIPQTTPLDQPMTVHLTAADLGKPPADAKTLLLVVDPDDVVAESDETNNVASLTINAADTSTTLAVDPTSAAYGEEVTFTAVVGVLDPGAGTPYGYVTFEDDIGPLGSGVLIMEDYGVATATFSTSSLDVGTYAVTAVYHPDDDSFNTSTSDPVDVTVIDKADTSTVIGASADQTVFGESVTFTAAVVVLDPGAGTPTGYVTFLDGGTELGSGVLSTDDNGVTKATFMTSALIVGIHNVTAVYGGDDNFCGSKSTDSSVGQIAEVTVDKADTSTMVASSTDEAVFGESVTFTAAVVVLDPGAGTPTGYVTFLDGGTELGSGVLSTDDNGVTKATFMTSALIVGIHNVTAVYGGDDNFYGSKSADSSVGQIAEVTVDKADTSTMVDSSTDEAVFGESVTFTAVVNVLEPGAGAPTGWVTFMDGGTELGSATLATANGVTTATFSISSLDVGTHTVTAVYSGDEYFAGSDSSTSGSSAVVTVTYYLPTAMVIDDGDPGFSTTGSWLVTAGEGYENDIHWAAKGTGDSVAAWTFAVVPGQYRVATTWTELSNRATNAQYAVYDDTTLVDTVQTNQRVAPQGFSKDGVQWEVLDYVNVASNTLVVRLSNKANKYVIADATRIERVGDVGPLPLQIVNDGGAGFSSTAAWSSVAGDGYLNDLQYCYKAASGVPADTASWTFNVSPGQYRVSTTWSPYKNRATNAPYTIYDGTTSLSTVKINQQLAPGDFTEHGVAWENLGVFNVSGNTLVVMLSNQANKYVIADAVRIERVGDVSPLPIAAIVDTSDANFGLKGTWDYWAQGYLGSVFGSTQGSGSNIARWAFDVTPGNYEVWTTWTAYSNRATKAPYTIYDGSTVLSTVSVDQTQTPSGVTEHSTSWQYLGTFTVAGTALTVRLSNLADGYVMADAVRIRQVLPLTVDAAAAPLGTPVLLTPEQLASITDEAIRRLTEATGSQASHKFSGTTG